MRMPSKHVHFAPDTSVYESEYGSPIPPTPYSLPSSLPTLSDSEDELLTPPSINYSGSPYSCTPLPSITTTPHPSIRNTVVYGNNNTPIREIVFPLTFDPATTILPFIPPSVLHQPATAPPLPYMTIVHKRLPWKITIRPAHPQHTPYVTVQDLVLGLYALLARPAGKGAYEAVPTDGDKARIVEAYVSRYRAAGDRAGGDRRVREAEKAAGVKMVDFLMGAVVFRGLSGTSKGAETWELHTSAS